MIRSKRFRRRFVALALAVITASAVLLSAAAPAVAQEGDWLMKSAAKPAVDPVISGFGPGDVRKTETQRAEAGRLALGNLGVTLGRRTSTDLDALQRLLDDGWVTRADVALQQALGVVLGDALERDIHTLHWAVVDDRYGHSRALRYRDTDALFFPITMISKRIGLGDTVDVQVLYDQVVAGVAGLEQEREATRRRTQGRR